jgi:hypothetical protein
VCAQVKKRPSHGAWLHVYGWGGGSRIFFNLREKIFFLSRNTLSSPADRVFFTVIGSFGAASEATNVVMRIAKCWSMVVMGSCADTAAGSCYLSYLDARFESCI